MNPEHASLLRCPRTGETLKLESALVEEGRVKSGVLVNEGDTHRYPIVNFIPRFVDEKNYAENFGLEWTLHSNTQYDDFSGYPISRERFQNETKWPSSLKGELILEAGCGSGRFTPFALDTGATVISFDYSKAVDSNYKSNGKRPNLLIVQADILNPPFSSEQFDKVFCFGVLQHTPDPKGSLLSLVTLLKPGGKFVSDIYLKSWRQYYLNPKYWIRPITKRIEPNRLYSFVEFYVGAMWPLAKLFRKLPKGVALNWQLLIADYSHMLPSADERILKEWAVLDTYDMLSPHYDRPQTLKGFRNWYEEANLSDIDVHYGYNGIEGRAVKPIKPDSGFRA